MLPSSAPQERQTKASEDPLAKEPRRGQGAVMMVALLAPARRPLGGACGLTRIVNTIIYTIMAFTITIDEAGRLVIPKPLRDRFGLTAGTRLHIRVEEGQILLSPERPEPRLVERDGFLVLDLPVEGPLHVDHRDERDRRGRSWIEYAAERR